MTERVLAIGLLTQRDLDLLGPSFNKLWPVEEAPSFVGILAAIDDADREMWRGRDQGHSRND